MDLRAAVTVALAACSSSSTSTNPPGPTVDERRELADRACPAVTQPTFFSIEKNGATSYLLGTRHAGIRVDKLPDYVRDKIHAAKVLVEESTDDGTGTPAALVPRDTTLDSRLSERAWGHYRELVGDAYAERVNHLAPATAIVGIVVLYEDVSSLVDVELDKEFRAAGKQVIALEDQKRSDAISDEMLGLPMLEKMIRLVHSRKQIEDSTTEDLAMYCRGDYKTPGDTDPVRRMSLERNADWIPTLQPLLDRGDVLISVGRDHVVASGGLVELLRRAGYRVRLVKP